MGSETRTMQPSELVAILERMYSEGLTRGEGVVMIHLFAIKYAAEIRACGETPRRIAEWATGHYRYGTEISKGMNLARYVRPQ